MQPITSALRFWPWGPLAINQLSDIGITYRTDHRYTSAMAQESRQQELLKKAKEADEQAEQVKDPKGHETWRKIAQLYRDLAKNT